MARITVEDCRKKVPNYFELILLAAQRARELAVGAPPTLAPDGDKPSIIALREIAHDTVDAEQLRQSLVKSMQRQVPEVDDFDESPQGEDFAFESTNQVFAETFGEEDVPIDERRAEPDQDNGIGDIEDVPELAEEDLVDLARDISFDEDAA